MSLSGLKTFHGSLSPLKCLSGRGGPSRSQASLVFLPHLPRPPPIPRASSLGYTGFTASPASFPNMALRSCHCPCLLLRATKTWLRCEVCGLCGLCELGLFQGRACCYPLCFPVALWADSCAKARYMCHTVQ